MKRVQLLLIHFIDLWSRHTSNPFEKFALFGFCFRFVEICIAFMFVNDFLYNFLWFGFWVASANYYIIIHRPFCGLEYSVSWKGNLEKMARIFFSFFRVANNFSFAQSTSMEINKLDYISHKAIDKSLVRTFFSRIFVTLDIGIWNQSCDNGKR